MKIILIFNLLCLSLIVQAQEIMFVQSAKAKVYAQPSFSAAVKHMLKKSDKVFVLVKKNDWIKIEHSSRRGWINQMLLANRKPGKRISYIAGKKLGNDARKRASSTVSTAAARGFRESDGQRQHQVEKGNYLDLEKIESSNISDKDLFLFQNEPEKGK